ncbi:MAG: rane protein of unknown function [Proteobacteria bacterium]|nr:rane protein of unknown function [Pseudomonadota bacterium]
MQSLLPLFLQIAIPLLVGIAVTAHLRQVTRVLLVDLCGTDDRANFWVRTTGILLTGTPLALVLVFGHSGGEIALAEIIRQAATLSLVGILLAVAFLARLIWKRVPPPAKPGQTASVENSKEAVWAS